MIRKATIADVWMAWQKPRNMVMFYHEAMLATARRPAWFVVRALIEATARDGAAQVYRDRGVQAFIRAEGRRGRPEHDIVMLATYGGGPGCPTDPDVWFRLLEALCATAARDGVQRFYAALPETPDELREVFRQVGFQCYTRQMVLHLDGPDLDQRTTIAPMRPQERRDVWAVHKLYGATTPHSVQLAEARSARDWQLPITRSLSTIRRAWVLGRDDDLAASLQLVSGQTAHVLTLIVRPDQRDIVGDVLRFGLGQVTDTSPVYLMLREYQQELLAPAADLGFEPLGEQHLVARQSTVPARRLFPSALRRQAEPRRPIPTTASLHDEVTPYAGSSR